MNLSYNRKPSSKKRPNYSTLAFLKFSKFRFILSLKTSLIRSFY
ncbi:hypothetical protein CWATWH0005_2411 [Crocosphaera watsonii WH 0005]|uniref:Uncharacterized protein n=1 Tax=Crocosphaera watsonii WH 0005 TaxID=423472 RepID=T2IYX5_CROWT|nr:hypothetical protein CWATWH0005_2411 [Crocosphaera watsonii WH 0005]